MSEAMAQVRDALGPDAIIVSTYEGRRGRGVEVRAAVEQAPAPAIRTQDDSIEARLRAQLQSELTQGLATSRSEKTLSEDVSAHPAPTDPERYHKAGRALVYHRVPSNLGKGILSLMRRIDAPDPDAALRQALDMRFTFAPIAPVPARPIVLIGPPGSGKTSTAAKLATQTVLSGKGVTLITTDTVKTGGKAQIETFAGLLGQPWASADTPEDLANRVGTRTTPVTVIDTPATNPFNRAEMRDLKTFIQAADMEPVLVIGAGGDMADTADMAQAFQALGATRMIVTRLDAARRHGGTLWAADYAGLAFAQASQSPYIANGLTTMNAALLCDLLTDIPPQDEKPPEDRARETAPPPSAIATIARQESIAR